MTQSERHAADDHRAAHDTAGPDDDRSDGQNDGPLAGAVGALERLDTDDVPEALADSSFVARASRAGMVARSVVYVISALLTVDIALSGYADEGPGRIGALQAAADQPFGRILLILLAVVFGGLSLWRFAAAIVGNGEGSGGLFDLWRYRVSPIGEGFLHLAMVAVAVSILLGPGPAESDNAARILGLPLGRWLVAGIGAGFLAAAAWNGYKVVTRTYRDDWKPELTGTERAVATVVSTAGLTGHMAMFGLVGYFLVKGGIEFDPSEPTGLDQSVQEVATSANGTVFLLALAGGMVAFAGHSLIEARCRTVLDG